MGALPVGAVMSYAVGIDVVALTAVPVLVGLGRAGEQAAALRRISDGYRAKTVQTLRTAFERFVPFAWSGVATVTLGADQ